MNHLTELGKDLLNAEMEDMNDLMDSDAKNHNLWQYRQWMVKKFSLPIEKEYEMVEDLLLADSWNNSAWNYRRWLCSLAAPELQPMILVRETKFALRWLMRNPGNEAIINYVLGFYPDPSSSTTELAQSHHSLKETVDQLEGTVANNSPLFMELNANLAWAMNDKEKAQRVSFVGTPCCNCNRVADLPGVKRACCHSTQRVI